MKDINKVIGSIKDMDSDEALEKVAKMVKNGEAGMTASQAISMANKLMPMLDKSQQEKLRKLIKKLKS
ncbi:MAG: hypothetical protein J6L92_04780 [Clostridia bacterium]|nr:hypothetical protein [Clostridia bacterium]